MRAAMIRAHGGPEAIEVAELPDPEPGPGELLVDVAAAGVNFVDVYYRTGAYPGDLPLQLGTEAAGRVAAVGEGVIGVEPGDRVAWAMRPGRTRPGPWCPPPVPCRCPPGRTTRPRRRCCCRG